MLNLNRYISITTRFINHYLGWRNWAVLVYNSIMENMFVIFYIALRQEQYSLLFITYFFLFLLFSSFCTTYGYLINDFGDKELDKLHGKDNTFKNDSNLKASLIVLFFLFLAILFSMPFIKSPLFIVLGLSWLSIATAYSIKPFRLKEKGKTGLIFVVIAQRVLPILIVFSAFNHYNWLDCIVLTIYIFFRGLSSDLNHQIEDFNNDLETKTDTFAVVEGKRKTRKIFHLSLEMEKALLFVCLSVMVIKLSHFEICKMPVLLPLFIFYILLYCWSWLKIKLHGRGLDVNPFTPGKKNIFQFIHHTFPSVLLPFYLLILLVSHSLLFLVILLFFVIVRKIYSFELIKNNFLIRIFLKQA